MTLHFALGSPVPAPLHPYGCRLEDIPPDCRTVVNSTPPPPQGWYSVGHWSALVSPNIFNGFVRPLVEVLAEMESEALDACGREGIEPLQWPAPPALSAAGVATVLLIPDPILRDLFR